MGDTRYGRINPRSDGGQAVPGYMAASQTFSSKSGRLVYVDSAGRLALVTASIALIWGEAQVAAGTPTVDDRVTVDIDPTAIYRLPVNAGTFVKAMIGKTCDLSISSNIQGVDLTASTRDVVEIVDGDLVGNAYVDVRVVRDLAKTGQGVGVV